MRISDLVRRLLLIIGIAGFAYLSLIDFGVLSGNTTIGKISFILPLYAVMFLQHLEIKRIRGEVKRISQIVKELEGLIAQKEQPRVLRAA